MAFARMRALRTLQSSLQRPARRSIPRFTRTQQLVQRRYASEGGSGGHAEETSDIPWAIGAIAVTAPACWYLWPDMSHADAGHHGDHEEHAEGDEGEEKEGEGQEEGAEEGGEQEGQQQAGEKQEGGEQEGGEQEGEKQEGGEQKEGKGEGSSEQGSEEQQQDSGEEKEDSEQKDDSAGDDPNSESQSPDQAGEEATKAEPEGKTGAVTPEQKDATSSGGNEPAKERGKKQKNVTSGAGKDLFADNTQGWDEASQKSKDRASQFGISTGATKHSTEIQKDPNKSKKNDGSPETAKAKGTVKPGS